MPSVTEQGRPISSQKSKPAVEAGTKTVTTAGTGVQFAALTIAEGYHVLIKALNANTDAIHIAESKTASETDSTAFEMDSSETLELHVENMNQLWIDANVNGEGVTFIVEADA